MDKEMMAALEADGEKLRQLTGEDHGPFEFEQGGVVVANNRMWLVHRPTGNALFLGKRMALGWYSTNPDDTRQNEFFDKCEAGFQDQDDFALVMEDTSMAPCATELSDYVHDGDELKISPKEI